MRIRHATLAVLIVGIIFGGVLISSALGIWQTDSSKTPQKIETGAFAGEGDPADIRGSYTFSDIANVFPISVDVLAEAFFVEENPADFQLKVLEANYPSDGEVEMGTSSVRLFVARYTGLPYERTGEEALFSHAVEFLVQEGKLSGEEAVLIPTMEPKALLKQEEETVIEEEHVEPLVKGNTTVADLFALGLSEEAIISVIGEYGSKGELVRDICNSNDVAFSAAKLTLEELAEE